MHLLLETILNCAHQKYISFSLNTQLLSNIIVSVKSLHLLIRSGDVLTIVLKYQLFFINRCKNNIKFVSFFKWSETLDLMLLFVFVLFKYRSGIEWNEVNGFNVIPCLFMWVLSAENKQFFCLLFLQNCLNFNFCCQIWIQIENTF